MRVPSAILVVALAGAAACGGSPTAAPTTPTPAQPTPPPAPVQPAVFTDSVCGFSTSDVYDAHDHVVRFDVNSSSLIWTIDGQGFPGFPISGNFVGAFNKFQILFGIEDSQRRAFFTETASGTICDIEVFGGQLVISPTTKTVPGGGC